MISREDWIDWKSNTVTKEFFNAIQERIEDSKEILASSAGLDQLADNFFRGFIAAQREVLDFRIDFEGDD